MRIVLTGGMGFIGSCLLKKLNEYGYTDILIVDSPTPEKEKNITGKIFKDVIEKNRFLLLVENGKIEIPDILLHFGACTSTINNNYQYMFFNNYHYSRTLAKWVLSGNKRFLYASSAATYGNGENGFSDEEENTSKLRPLNVYGLSKHLFDLWLIINGLVDKAVGFKFFNVYGPNEYHKGEMRSVVVKAYDEIKKTGKKKLFKSYRDDIEDGEQKRDFIYVEDVVDVIMFFVEHPEKNGIYNVGTGKARSFNDLVKAVFNYLRLSPSIEYIDMPHTIDRDKYQYFTQADIRKLRKAGFTKEFTELEDGISRYLGYLEGKLYI
ncbi:MAG: ADP-glyceromanno-heptose 6-epimerase [Candidatus Omnitrophica bacterium]|nr:ADP-glyceromanno-heptose 6-epimerase [Candidatus Omnitrophota bacterium]